MKKNILLFVYNADSSFFATMTDYVHKIISPKTYACNLCKLTYGNLGMKEKWKNFLSTLPYEKQFQHKDEFLRAHPAQKEIPLPAIFSLCDEKMYTVIDGKEIEKASSLNDLIEKVSQELKKL